MQADAIIILVLQTSCMDVIKVLAIASSVEMGIVEAVPTIGILLVVVRITVVVKILLKNI